MKRHGLEHLLWKQLQPLIQRGDSARKIPILVGLSGGIDSLALLAALWAVHGKNKTVFADQSTNRSTNQSKEQSTEQAIEQNRDPILVGAAYFHHGPSKEKQQGKYRNEAQNFCQKWCEERGIPFYSNEGTHELVSEADQREARYRFFYEKMEQHSYKALALGHHLDDLLETRMLRLIRGTGLQGLPSMQVWDGQIFRPFLEVSKSQLQEYLQDQRLQAMQDPSNEGVDPLRNWLRQVWLPQLENRSPGSVDRLGISLQNIVDECHVLQERSHSDSFTEFSLEEGISRSYFLTLNENEKLRLLAKYLLAKKHPNFGRAHLEEVVKHLDNSQKDLNFRVARLNWIINAAQIKVES